tara:strand:+ start:252 stop:461 length:210 start_codon:yes stop_codon:yes gene_type:complete
MKDKLINEVYTKAREIIETEKLNPIDFSGALISVAKLILVETVGAKDAEILFDFADKSFIIDSKQITYH